MTGLNRQKSNKSYKVVVFRHLIVYFSQNSHIVIANNKLLELKICVCDYTGSSLVHIPVDDDDDDCTQPFGGGTASNTPFCTLILVSLSHLERNPLGRAVVVVVVVVVVVGLCVLVLTLWPS